MSTAALYAGPFRVRRSVTVRGHEVPRGALLSGENLEPKTLRALIRCAALQSVHRRELAGADVVVIPPRLIAPEPIDLTDPPPAPVLRLMAELEEIGRLATSDEPIIVTGQIPAAGEVSFMAEQGERVSVSTPREAAQADAGGPDRPSGAGRGRSRRGG